MCWRSNWARAIVHYATVDGRSDIAGRLLDILGVAAVSEATRLPVHHTFGSLDVTLNIVEGNLFDQDTYIAVGFSDTFDTLDRGNLLRLILLSFVAYSRLRLICHDLRIVISPSDVHRVNLIGLRDFLDSL